MIRLQEWIYQLEVGGGARVLRVALALLAFGAVALVFNYSEFKNLDNEQGMDLAQVARNVSEGKGLTTQWIRPISIYLVEERQAALGEPADVWGPLEGGHPDLANPPGYPLLLGLFMKMLPMRYEIPSSEPFSVYQPDLLIALVNQFLFFLLVGLVFWVGTSLFDRDVGWMSALVLGGTEMFWEFSIKGVPYFLTALVFVSLIQTLHLAERGARERDWSTKRLLWFAALAGALVALGGMTRYGFIWLILPVVGFLVLCFPTRRAPMAIVGLIVFLFCLAPWLVRNYSLSGTMFGICTFQLASLAQDPGASDVIRSFHPVVEDALVGTWFERGTSQGVGILRDQFPYLGGGWLGGLFLAGLLLPFRDPGRSRVRILVLVVIITAFLVEAVVGEPDAASPVDTNARSLLMVAVPLVCVFGAGLFMSLVNQLDLEMFQVKQLITGLAVLVLSLPLLLRLLPPSQNPRAFPPYAPQHIQRFCSWMDAGELMMSDQPSAVAWYGNRVCLSLTELVGGDDEERGFSALDKRQGEIKALYLSRISLDAPFFSGVFSAKPGTWDDFVGSVLSGGDLPDGFPLRHAPREYLGIGHLFLTDQKRWSNSDATTEE